MTHAIKEETTYERGCSLDGEEVKIPDEAVLETPSILSDVSSCIFYDLETAKLGSAAEITQLATVS